jgi:signal transduction histidine kinase
MTSTPLFSADGFSPAHRQLNQLVLRSIAWGMCVIAFVGALIDFSFIPDEQVTQLVLVRTGFFIFTAAVFLIAGLAAHKGALRSSVLLIVIALYMSSLMPIFIVKFGIHAATAPVLFVPVLIAGLVCGRRELWLLTGISFVALLGAWVFEYQGNLADGVASVRIGGINRLFALLIILASIVLLVDRFGIAFRQTLSDLATRTTEAEAATHAKGRFLANMTHELHTPLHGILGMAQLLRMDGNSDEDRHEFADELITSARRLEKLLSNLLELTRLEASAETIKYEPFSVQALLNDLCLRESNASTARGQALSVALDATLPATVLGDPTHLTSALRQLLDNVAKYAQAGNVVLGARRVEHASGKDRRINKDATHAIWVELSVSDSGPGVPPELLPRLFQPFAKGDDSLTSAQGGTGLGLAMVAQIARLLGGEADAINRPEGGASFRLRLPLDIIDRD